jgi:transposase
VFNGLHWIVRTDAAWWMMPHDLPPWHTVYQQSHRGLKAGVFEAVVHDLREGLWLAHGRTASTFIEFGGAPMSSSSFVQWNHIGTTRGLPLRHV